LKGCSPGSAAPGFRAESSQEWTTSSSHGHAWKAHDRLVPLHDLARRTATVRSDLIEDLREEMTVALD